MSNFKCSECGTINIDCGKEGYKTPKEIELEKSVKDLEQKPNTQFAEMEEKLTAEEMKNYKLKEKLKIAEEALNDIKNSFFEDKDKEIITHAESIYYYSKAKETLQKIKEVKND